MRAGAQNYRHTDITSSDSEAPTESIIQALRAENKRLRDLVRLVLRGPYTTHTNVPHNVHMLSNSSTSPVTQPLLPAPSHTPSSQPFSHTHTLR